MMDRWTDNQSSCVNFMTKRIAASWCQNFEAFLNILEDLYLDIRINQGYYKKNGLPHCRIILGETRKFTNKTFVLEKNPASL